MRKLFFIITAAIVVFIVIVFFVISLFPKNNTSPNNSAIPVPTKVQTIVSPGSKPPILYDTKKANQLVDKMKTRTPLSQNGTAARQAIISSLNGTSGPVYTTTNVRIGYVAAPNLFQAEILSSNISAAKQEATAWMLSRGFTQADLCNLPLSFYLGPDAATTLKDTNNVFNPLPNNC